MKRMSSLEMESRLCLNIPIVLHLSLLLLA